MKKYKLTDETIEYKGHTLYRIEALRDFSDVREGEKGGFVESENNLSHYDNCWIYDYAKVYDDAVVYGDAKIKDYVNVFNYSDIYGNAVIFDNVKIYDHAKISGNAYISGNSEIYGYASIHGNVLVGDFAKVRGTSNVIDNATIGDYAIIDVIAFIDGHTKIVGDAIINKNSDYIVFKNWWSSGRWFTWTKSNNMWSVGCFYGTGEELIRKAYKDSEESGREYERIVKYVESIK